MSINIYKSYVYIIHVSSIRMFRTILVLFFGVAIQGTTARPARPSGRAPEQTHRPAPAARRPGRRPWETMGRPWVGGEWW